MGIIQHSWRRFAQSVVSVALADLGKIDLIRLFSGSRVILQDDAAWWFAENKHEPWCEMAELDAKEVKEAAILIAQKVEK